ncbi:GNAT family N-acetyltransferase [Albitalea terrae]|uniref:GNAT family N-acetyltransferase n=2 Tax=Piscinibacter terrae TaxID=2496871 RepID=A0A3N7JX17_9BURK|nr:GNAT family N-acetyltransferase [Albitalea terrae]
MASFAHDALKGVMARPMVPGDLEFLQGLYASTRAAEMAATGWTEAQCRQFLDGQFELQHHYYQAHHAGADFLLLSRGAQPIGRLYWRERDDTASLIDVSLLPAERGRGIGSALMHLLVQRADERGLAIELHVEPDNPALRLYRRFGFDVAKDNGVYARMRREPEAFTVVSSEGCIA